MATSQEQTRKKLKPLVITLGSKRRAYIEALFNEPCMKEHFEAPTFSNGVPSRELRSCYSFLQHAANAGIIPTHEWEAIAKAKQDIVDDETRSNNDNYGLLDRALKDVPVMEGRRGSKEDVKLHYCKELWQKAKGINRGRNVLACLFAHLIAMKKLVDEGFDFILEDNVRAPISKKTKNGYCKNDGDVSRVQEGLSELLSKNDEIMMPPCAKRIHESIEASHEWEREFDKQCHLRYYGWLGSRPNLEFIIRRFSPKMRYQRKCIDVDNNDDYTSFFPFPVTSDFDDDEEESNETSTKIQEDVECEIHDDPSSNTQKKAGGTPLWGAYAYWISKEGHQAIIDSLQKDVGSLLWKGKRMRYYVVKPVDKVMPRKIISAFSCTKDAFDGREHVHVATDPAFFRAPMLTSQIHSQWDAEFCRSTEFQMNSCFKSSVDNLMSDEENELVWETLWLTEQEREIVEFKKREKKWLTLKELETNSSKDS